MKLTVRILFVLAATSVLMTYSGCKSKHGAPEPITDQQIDKFNGKSFKVTAVTLGSVDKVADGTYPITASATSPLTITLTGNKGTTDPVAYAVTNRPSFSPWEATGTLTFDSTSPQTELTRDDGVAVTYLITVTTTTPITTTLQMSFNFASTTGYPNPRAANVQGLWSFTFTATN